MINKSDPIYQHIHNIWIAAWEDVLVNPDKQTLRSSLVKNIKNCTMMVMIFDEDWEAVLGKVWKDLDRLVLESCRSAMKSGGKPIMCDLIQLTKTQKYWARAWKVAGRIVQNIPEIDKMEFVEGIQQAVKIAWDEFIKIVENLKSDN